MNIYRNHSNRRLYSNEKKRQQKVGDIKLKITMNGRIPTGNGKPENGNTFDDPSVRPFSPQLKSQ